MGTCAIADLRGLVIDMIPIRVEYADGTMKMRVVERLEHGPLCRALGLDPVRFYFDLPSSCREIGSNMSGRGGNRGRRKIDGYVWMHGAPEPFAKLVVAEESDKFRDVDPMDRSELFRLGR